MTYLDRLKIVDRDLLKWIVLFYNGKAVQRMTVPLYLARKRLR